MTIDTGADTSRRAFLRLVGYSVTAAAGAGLLGGCGDKAAEGGATQKLDSLAGVLPESGPLPAGIPKPDVISTRPVADGFRQGGVVHGRIDVEGVAPIELVEAPAWRSRRSTERPELAPIELHPAVAHTGLRAAFAFPDGSTLIDRQPPAA